jgi:serine/threonine protein kinase
VIEELVGGTSLREACGRRGAPPTRIFLELARSAAKAVASLHGLTKGGAKGGASCAASHGDLGPDHVFVDTAGALRFVDFGAARFVGMDPTLDTDDRGTLPYAAPEIVRGEVKPDQAGDVYALAATLLFVARGGRPLLPFEDRAAMLLAIGDRGLPAVLFDGLSLPDRVRDALRRALAFDRSERLTTARELAAALEGD